MNCFRLLGNLYRQKRNTQKTRRQIEFLQKRKLEKMLRYAYENSPYYRETFEAAGIHAETIAKTPDGDIKAACREAEGTVRQMKRIISCGEPLSPGLRKYLENAFETEVMNFYGASESLALEVEARADEGMFLFDDLNVVEVIDGEMYLTCLYNYTQPLIRYHISDRLVLHEAEQGEKCSFTKADVLLCRNEDVLWFETKGGRMEYLHPLSIEGLCIDGLLDYQFRQTSKNSFEMTAEISTPFVKETVRNEIERQMQTLLNKNGLADIYFSIRFTTQIMPDTATGKKSLIVKQEEQDMTTKKEYRQEYLTGERALFQGENLRIVDTIFDDGESPLKESHDIDLVGCMFKWKYPLWYSKNITAKNCTWFEMGRAGVWYTKHITVEDSAIEAPKNFRRCEDVTLRNVSFPNAAETLWHCEDVSMEQVMAKGDYFAMNSRNMKISGLTLYGNYSFDGAENVEIRNSRLLSKDSFWNSNNVTVYDSFISGEYLGWNAKNLTLINCTIESLQGMCYIDNLVMKNCKLLNTTLAFEYSTVDVDIDGRIDSVKNPSGGVIRADSIAELIIEKDKVDPDKVKIVCRQDEKKRICVCA